MIRKAALLLMLMWAAVSLFSGCIAADAKKTEWKQAKPASRPPFVHTVKYPGETLPIIAKWYTGDVNNWEALADANPNIDYEHLMTGTGIFIPENLLKKTKPLTKKYLDSKGRNSRPAVKEEKKKPDSKTETRPGKEEDLDLFGPK